MATPHACLDLLSMLSLADNRRFDEGVAIGWSEFLYDLPDEVLIPAGRDAIRNSDTYITPQVIGKFAAPHMRRIASAVKSAKVRRLVPADWPATRPLPADIAARIADEWAANNDRPAEIAPLQGKSINIGQVGRRIPEDGDAA